MVGTDRSDEQLRLRATLASIAPGTALRDGLERILRGRTGALIVLGHDKTVESISTGGFTSTCRSPPPACASWPRWTARSSSTRTSPGSIRAAVHLMPDHTIPSEETGTRHRTADRVARQTGFPVISVSQSMQIIAAYVGETRHVLEDSGQILSRANQALATLERYKLRLDEVSSTLSALEIEDLVTVRDVAVVAQRLEMVTRIAREIEDYVLELGTDGRLLVAPARGADHRRRRRARAGDPRLPARRPARHAAPRSCCQRLEALSATELVDPAAAARALGLGTGEHLDGAVAPRGYRLLAKVPRLPTVGRRPAGRPLRHPAEAALRRHRRPAGRRGRRRAARPQRPRGALPAGRVDDPRALRLTHRRRPWPLPAVSRSCGPAGGSRLLARPSAGVRPCWRAAPAPASTGLGVITGRGGRLELELQVGGLAGQRGRARRGSSRAAPTRSAREHSSSERWPLQVTSTVVVDVAADHDVLARDRPRALPARPDVVVARGDLHGQRLGRDLPGAGLATRSCAARGR